MRKRAPLALRAALTVGILAVAPIGAGTSAPQVGSLLDRAAERAILYESSSLDWTCDETVKSARYGGDGEASRGSEQRFALLMTRDDEGPGATETRFREPSHDASPAPRPGTMDGFPSPTAWLRLFHPSVAGFELFEEGGEDGSPRRALTFRGALPYARGDDIREWEGTAWLDPETGDLLSIEAVPSSQDARLAILADTRSRHSLGLAIFGFRFRVGPKAYGRRVEVSFGDHGGGLWLPEAARLETFEAVSPTTRHTVRVVVDSIERCRRFETSATPGEAR